MREGVLEKTDEVSSGEESDHCSEHNLHSDTEQVKGWSEVVQMSSTNECTYEI